MIIHSSQIAVEVFKKHLINNVEEFWVMALNSNLQLLQLDMLFRGTVDKCLVHPRDVFRFACLHNATSLIIAHNHPSGDPLPSLQDINLTKKLIKASHLLEIPILDHIIISHSGYSSLADYGMFPQRKI